MLKPNYNFLWSFYGMKIKNLTKIKACDNARHHLIFLFRREKIDVFGPNLGKNTKKEAFLTFSNQNHPFQRVEGEPLYIIIFLNLEKVSKIKISYIRTLIYLYFGYNGYIYNKIEILYFFLFQEALYA